MLTAAGFEWYEISNWARPGEACRHNQCYWTQGEYLAIGCAAHGHTDGRRWWNVRTPERYIDRVASGASTEAGSETLDPRDAREEAFVARPAHRGGRATAAAAPKPAAAELVDAGPARTARRPDRADPPRAGSSPTM